MPMFALPPFAAGEDFVMPGLASGLVAAGVFVLVRSVANTLRTDDLEQDDAWRYDVTRINALRRISPLYRFFQPVIQLFAAFNRGAFRESLPEISREIQAAGLPRYWTGAEYLARMQLIGFLLSPLYLYAFVEMMGPAGAVPGIVLTLGTIWWLRRRLRWQAHYRLFQIKKRLPFLLDLLTLLMEAGSTFLQALGQAVAEYRQHAAGVEFGRVLAELNMGKTRVEAFESMRQRLSDDEITSIIGSIIQGEQLGTPLARIFRTTADVLRVKRTQRAETIAGEAGVKMLGPAILVMAATVIIILGPFVLSFIYAEFMS